MENKIGVWLFYIIVGTIGISLLIAIGITKFSWFSWSLGDANGWLGFWGSFLGGIIGTLSVLYVAFSQDSKQEKLINDERKILLLKNVEEEIKDVLIELSNYRNEFMLYADKCNDRLSNITYYSEEKYNKARSETNEKSERNITKYETTLIYNRFNLVKVHLKIFDNTINTDLIKPDNVAECMFVNDTIDKFRKYFFEITENGTIKGYQSIFDEIDKLYLQIIEKQAKTRKEMIGKLNTH
jgi:hypothetical protein